MFLSDLAGFGKQYRQWIAKFMDLDEFDDRYVERFGADKRAVAALHAPAVLHGTPSDARTTIVVRGSVHFSHAEFHRHHPPGGECRGG